MAEINISKTIKRILDTPENKRTQKLIDLDDEDALFDLIEETEGLIGLEPNMLEAAEAIGAVDFLDGYGEYLRCAILFMNMAKGKKEDRLPMILDAYEESEEPEYFFYTLAGINEYEEINIMNALYTAAVLKNDIDFVSDYMSEMNSLTRFIEMAPSDEMKELLEQN